MGIFLVIAGFFCIMAAFGFDEGGKRFLIILAISLMVIGGFKLFSTIAPMGIETPNKDEWKNPGHVAGMSFDNFNQKKGDNSDRTDE